MLTAALAAIACTLPGNYLLLRRQSLLGDALSHAVLPGIVIGYLSWNLVESSGWFPISQTAGWRPLVLFAGAACSGLLAVLAAEWTHRLGRIDAGAALGVVFTSFFALGLLLIRLKADQAHIDPSCVLYGNLEMIVMDRIPGTPIPRAAVVNGLAVLLNVALWLIFYKELQLAAFDPGLAETLGIRVSRLHYGVAAATAATVVAAFETVGSILVIAMLIVPVATARLLTDRLRPMILVSVMIAGLSAVLGHIGAMVIPKPLFAALGYPAVEDAGTAGMMSLAAGLLFVLALIAGPKHGLVRRAWDRAWWQIQTAADDLLGILYRQEELPAGERLSHWNQLAKLLSQPSWAIRLAARRLTHAKWLVMAGNDVQLTDAGRSRARELVRSHRLWEAFLAQRFRVPEGRVHASAEKVEHFLGESLREELAAELQQSTQDPHGRAIPPER
jgi:manganese/zinc/iron transport system permease protein